MPSGCGKEMQVHVAKGWGYKEITVRCGNTSPTGYPWLCEPCSERLKDVDWKREAMLNGEAWGEEDY